jgi:drug/metabolite transporter (DMT)-like permease
MAQTKRKRRTKHRGNAAGSIEARGRTGRKPTPQEAKAAARGQRRAKPPTWNSAALKAFAMAVLLFILTQLGIFGSETTASQGIFLAAMAMLIYTPLAYATDKFVYNRMQRAQQQKKP